MYNGNPLYSYLTARLLRIDKHAVWLKGFGHRATLQMLWSPSKSHAAVCDELKCAFERMVTGTLGINMIVCMLEGLFRLYWRAG